MDFEKTAAAFLSFAGKTDAAPYTRFIKAGISDAESRIRPEFAEEPPECVIMYAAAAAVLLYISAECAGDAPVCGGEGRVLADRNTEDTRRAAELFADRCLAQCSRYFRDDRFVIAGIRKERENT